MKYIHCVKCLKSLPVEYKTKSAGALNVYLKNIESGYCTSCDTTTLSIPKAPELVKTLFIAFAKSNREITLNDFTEIFDLFESFYSKEEIAQKLDVHSSTINDWLSGSGVISLVTQQTIKQMIFNVFEIEQPIIFVEIGNNEPIYIDYMINRWVVVK